MCGNDGEPHDADGAATACALTRVKEQEHHTVAHTDGKLVTACHRAHKVYQQRMVLDHGAAGVAPWQDWY